jgi:hypothetical protein
MKNEVDRALHFILEGLEKLGPVYKPNCVGRYKGGKKWLLSINRGPSSFPNPF